MSDEAKETKDKSYVQNLTDLASFNSYGVVTLSNGQRVNVQMTTRHAMTAEAAYKDFQAHVAFLDMCARDHAVEFWDGSRADSGKTSAAVKQEHGDEPAKQGNGKRDERKPLEEKDIPGELVDINGEVYAVEFDYFVIKPDLDGKSVVQFWKDDPNLKFPVGATMNKWKHETICEYLSHLTDQKIDPSKPDKVRIAGIQYFTLGKEYQGRNGPARYKDIQLLKPIF